MYLLFVIIFIICLICYIFCRRRRKRAAEKVHGMDCCEKLRTLNGLLQPFGFAYNPGADAVTSLPDAWQRDFGYCALYDKTAVRFNMVFDCEPVYFDYDGRTWLIEFWKGQYGMNLGGEIGIYRADTVLSPKQYRRTVFDSIPDEEMLPLSMELDFEERPFFSIQRRHWWLTGFRVGRFGRPRDLSMRATLVFPNEEMANCFVTALVGLGYTECGICVCGTAVTFRFDAPHHKKAGLLSRLHAWYSQLENRLFCRLYRRVTRCFSDTMDQILYLYYLLPFAFRHTMRFRRNRRQKPRRTR